MLGRDPLVNAVLQGHPQTETDPDGSSFDSDVEITFEEQNGKALMTMVQKGFPSAEMQEQHEVGLPHAFDHLERVVQARVSGSGEESSLL